MLHSVQRAHLRGAAVTDALIEEIYALVSRHARKSIDEVREQLRACDHVYPLRAGDGVVRALICFRTVLDRCGERPAFVLYGQWTILDDVMRGGNWTTAATADAFARERFWHPWHAAYCVIKCSTFKSYLMMARRAGVAYPTPGVAIPDDLKALQDRVMACVVGDRYDPVAGVVRGKGEMEYREGAAWELPSLDDPHLALYARLNPGQRNGDGLVLTTPFTLANWCHGAVNITRRVLRRVVAVPPPLATPRAP